MLNLIKAQKILCLFITGGIGYNIIEILWRGYTHISMTIAGGLCFTAMIYINKLPLNIAGKALFSCLVITAVELIFGLIVNIKLKLNVWDYSTMPFNFMGQICLPYSGMWFCLGIFVHIILNNIKEWV